MGALQTVIAIVGRPNVGKSTLFNCLTRTKEAVVLNFPGVTRDRRYGKGKFDQHNYIVVDTYGLYGDEEEDKSDIGLHSQAQTQLAMEEANCIFFILDAKVGVTELDKEIAQDLRKLGKPIFLVINKTDGLNPEVVLPDFYQLGLTGALFPISAVHRRGLHTLMETALKDQLAAPLPSEDTDTPEEQPIKITVVGRPNAGKSTFINQVLGEDRLVVSPVAGTTRDAIEVPFTRQKQPYILVDTAGMRKKAKVKEAVEKISAIKTLQAIEQSDVVILMLDAKAGFSNQDLHILGWILESHKPLIISVNKWETLGINQKKAFRSELDRMLFIDFAPIHYISALERKGIGEIFKGVKKAYLSAMKEHSSSLLTELLQQATSQHPTPIVHRNRIKLRYAHQGGKKPPIIVIHGTQVEALPTNYQRYLINFFMKKLRLVGTPIRLSLKSSKNPFAGKKNPLTERQLKKRRRLKKHIRKK